MGVFYLDNRQGIRVQSWLSTMYKIIFVALVFIMVEDSILFDHVSRRSTSVNKTFGIHKISCDQNAHEYTKNESG